MRVHVVLWTSPGYLYFVDATKIEAYFLAVLHAELHNMVFEKLLKYV